MYVTMSGYMNQYYSSKPQIPEKRIGRAGSQATWRVQQQRNVKQMHKSERGNVAACTLVRFDRRPFNDCLDGDGSLGRSVVNEHSSLDDPFSFGADSFVGVHSAEEATWGFSSEIALRGSERFKAAVAISVA